MKRKPNAIIWTDFVSYTADECYETGFRHGRDGTRFYPCSQWETDDIVNGNRTLATSRYADGYRDGRQYWKELCGYYPTTGSTHLDVAEFAH